MITTSIWGEFEADDNLSESDKKLIEEYEYIEDKDNSNLDIKEILKLPESIKIMFAVIFDEYSVITLDSLIEWHEKDKKSKHLMDTLIKVAPYIDYYELVSSLVNSNYTLEEFNKTGIDGAVSDLIIRCIIENCACNEYEQITTDIMKIAENYIEITCNYNASILDKAKMTYGNSHYSLLRNLIDYKDKMISIGLLENPVLVDYKLVKIIFDTETVESTLNRLKKMSLLGSSEDEILSEEIKLMLLACNKVIDENINIHDIEKKAKFNNVKIAIEKQDISLRMKNLLLIRAQIIIEIFPIISNKGLWELINNNEEYINFYIDHKVGTRKEGKYR